MYVCIKNFRFDFFFEIICTELTSRVDNTIASNQFVELRIVDVWILALVLSEEIFGAISDLEASSLPLEDEEREREKRGG